MFVYPNNLVLPDFGGDVTRYVDGAECIVQNARSHCLTEERLDSNCNIFNYTSLVTGMETKMVLELLKIGERGTTIS